MRKYLPTLGELIDRLTICQLKEVKIPNKKSEYGQEIKEIVSDINKIIQESDNLEFDGDLVRAIVVLSQMNTHIWVNEDNARNGDNKGNELLLTHGLNGIRNTAKNKIQEKIGGRKDYKIDCLASEFSDWEISWDEPIDNNRWDIIMRNQNPGGFNFQVFQKKDSDFQIITTAKCGTRFLDYVTGFSRNKKENEKQIESRFWNLRMDENDRWRWFEIEFTYEYQIKASIQDKEEELEGLKYVWNWDKKDTLLLYRHPVDRIRSGILQKCNSWYHSQLEMNESGETIYNLDQNLEKDFKNQLKILKDNFPKIFPHIHMKDNHCNPWSTYSLQLMNDLELTPKIVVNLDIKEHDRNGDLDKWLRAVGSEEEIKRIDKLNTSAINSNHSIFRFGDDILLHELIQPFITQELISYNILEQKRCKL